MATLGKTTTPTTTNFGWISQTNEQVAMLFNTPQGGLFSSVTFWAAGSTTLKIHGVIWNGSGAVLAFGPGVNTSGGAASGVGAVRWVTDTFASPVFIPGGANIYIGWQLDVNATPFWAFNGGDHSPNALENPSSTGSSGQPFTTASTESPSGAVAAYATYTPTGIKVRRGGAWVEAPLYVRRSGVWVPVEAKVRRSGSWVTTG